MLSSTIILPYTVSGMSTVSASLSLCFSNSVLLCQDCFLPPSERRDDTLRISVYHRCRELLRNYETVCSPSTVAALAVDKVMPRPYHFRSGPASGPTTRPHEAKKVKLKSPVKFSLSLLAWHFIYIRESAEKNNL